MTENGGSLQLIKKFCDNDGRNLHSNIGRKLFPTPPPITKVKYSQP